MQGSLLVAQLTLRLGRGGRASRYFGSRHAPHFDGRIVPPIAALRKACCAAMNLLSCNAVNSVWMKRLPIPDQPNALKNRRFTRMRGERRELDLRCFSRLSG